MISVFAVLRNNGDGSSSICWFDGSEVCIEELLELEERDPETWGSGEGLQVNHFRYPDDFDFDLCGIQFSDIEEIRLDLNP